MRELLVLACVTTAAVGCKKTGGGGWLVGERGMLVHVDEDGALVRSDDLATTDPMYALACRYAGEAWAVGANGTVRHTSDDARTWIPIEVPTRADLHALATTAGPIYLGGDHAFLVSSDSGATWSLSSPAFDVRSIAATGGLVLAVSSDGAVWSYAGTTLTRLGTVPGARAIAVASDGATAIIAGDGLARSDDGGATWSPLAVDPSLTFDDVHLSQRGDAIAVGANGAIARIDASGAVRVQHVGTGDLHAVHIADAADEDGLGYAAGEAGQLAVTQDSGDTWTIVPRLPQTVYSIDEIGVDHR